MFLRELYRQRPTSVLTLVCALILLVPVVLNGRPFLFSDSVQYYDVGKAAVGSVIDLEPSQPIQAAPDAAEPSGIAPSEPKVPDAPDYSGAEYQEGLIASIAGSRSIAYSLIVYISSVFLSIWLIPMFQALAVGWSAVRLKDWLAPDQSPKLLLLTVAALAVLSPLGMHVGFIMPDLLAGLLLVCMLRLFFQEGLSRLETAVLLGLVLLASLVHTTTLLLGVTGVLLALIWKWFAREEHARIKWPSIALSSMMLVTAAFANIAYLWLAETITGDEMGRPPFLMARMIDDGPGMALLNKVCPEDPDAYKACVFAGYEYVNHNDLLWTGNGQPPKPRVLFLTTAEKAELQNEEIAFVLHAFANQPVSQIIASLHNTFDQLRFFGIREIDEGTTMLAQYFTTSDMDMLNYIPGASECIADPAGCLNKSEILNYWVLVAYYPTALAFIAFLFILALWLRTRFTDTADSIKEGDLKLLLMSALAIMLLANAAICGALSGPHDRYQARLIWIVPLLLVLTAHAWRKLPLIAQIENRFK